MKNTVKYKAIVLSLAIGFFCSCKKTAPETETNTMAGSESYETSTDTVSGNGDMKTNEMPSGSEMKSTRKKGNMKMPLTSEQKDSIKAERDKIVTPPDNIGASKTPGSGRATPKNTATLGGTNASQGSSTGDK